jgi:dCTP deaminase
MLNDYMIRCAVFPEQVRPDRPEAQKMVYTPQHRIRLWGDIQDSQIQPASLDVRLAPDFIRHPDGELICVDKSARYLLSPGECVLASTIERLHMPDNVVCRVEGKSSLARLFLTVHSAGFIDPGFRGDVTLELKNDGARRLELQPGMLIAQLSFQALDAPAVRPYGHRGLGSHYQEQWGPTSALGVGQDEDHR